MTPTPEQIEAAAKAIVRNNNYPLPLTTARALAETALTAAAEVARQERVANWGNPAAAEVEDPMAHIARDIREGRFPQKSAAAEVGEDDISEDWKRGYETAMKSAAEMYRNQIAAAAEVAPQPSGFTITGAANDCLANGCHLARQAAAAEVGDESTMEHIARDIKAGIFPRKSPAAEVDWPSQELVNDLVASATEEDNQTVHAAAEVGPTYTEDGLIPSVKNPGQPMTNEEYQDIATKQRAAALTAVAEVGLPIDLAIKEAVDAAIAATIERCAQVADKYEQHKFGGDDQYAIGVNDTVLYIAAAIRALKDSP